MDQPTVIVAVGGIHPRNAVAQLLFAPLSALSYAQARLADGCLKAAVTKRGDLYFSLTVWSSPAAMRAFGRRRAHGLAMTLSDRLADRSFFHRYPAAAIPDWPEAFAAWDAAV